MIASMVVPGTEVDPQLGALLGESTTEIDVARKNRVFCNRNLRMDGIEMIGFDMDYTLALYHQDKLEQLSIELTLKKLVEKHGYDEEIKHLRYDPGWAIRGLVVDRTAGNVFKMDRHAYVGRCYHGFREVAPDERKHIYRNEKINLSSDRYEWIDTLFALFEAVMYMTLVDWSDRTKRTARLRQAFRRYPYGDRRGPPRRHAEERDQGEPAGVHRQGPDARRDAAQVPQLGQEAVSPDELALRLHDRRDELPPRRRAQGVPVVAELLRQRDRGRREAGVLQRAAPVRAGRSGRPARRQNASETARSSTCTRDKVYQGGNVSRVRADDRHQGRAGLLHRRSHLRRHPAAARSRTLRGAPAMVLQEAGARDQRSGDRLEGADPGSRPAPTGATGTSSPRSTISTCG